MRYKGTPIPLFIVIAASIAVSAFWLHNESDIKVNKPEFSVDSGFYSTDIYLEINSDENTRVYYTLDGSSPDKNSYLYENPIHITDATENDNVYCNITDVVLKGKRIPNVNIDKCTIIRAIAISDNGARSDIVTKSFFVDFDEKDGYENMNIISMVTDPGNLFDSKIGIYVLGDEYQNYLWEVEEGKRDPVSKWEWTPANYHNAGKKWEREGNIEFFNLDRECILNKTVGIRIQGNISRAYNPKSFNLYARNEYDNEDCFNIDFFSDGYNASKLTLSAGGNNYKVNIKDYIVDKLIGEDTNVTTMKFEPCCLFIDGEYWGTYWLENKYDEAFFKYYYDVPPTDILMIKNGQVELGNEADIVIYNELMNFVKNDDMSIESNYAKACEMIDMNSMIDYYAIYIFLARRGDWPRSNTAIWRSKGNDGFGNQKWHFVVFDMNSNGLSDSAHDTLSYVIERDALFGSMWENESFRKAFSSRIIELSETIFEPSRVEEICEYINTTYRESRIKSTKRYRELENEDEYVIALAYEGFFNDRQEYINNTFR